MRLVRLELKSDNTIKLKALKFTVKKYCLIIGNNGNRQDILNIVKKFKNLEKQVI